MKDFIGRNKIFLGVVIATLILLVGGVYFFSKGGSAQKPVLNEILIPKGTQITSGIKDGVYLPVSSSAKVTLVEFGDYQCPACGAYSALVKQAMVDFASKVNFAFRDMAFIGPESVKSAEATYCALDQGKFWEFHDYLYSHQNGENRGSFSDTNLKSFAATLKLNQQSFANCLDTDKYKTRVTDSTSAASALGINSTPTFYINGIKIDSLPSTYEAFKSLIQDSLNNSPISAGSPAATFHIHFDLKTYVAGTPINFTLSKYQESQTNPLDKNIHFHDGNGSIVHVHKENTPLSELFSSLKISFQKDTSSSNLKVFVNGTLNPKGLDYVPNDLDQILVSYGPINDTSIQKQISSLTKDSCIYSLKCPDRGTPPPEECVGGLGTGCETD